MTKLSISCPLIENLVVASVQTLFYDLTKYGAKSSDFIVDEVLDLDCFLMWSISV